MADLKKPKHHLLELQGHDFISRDLLDYSCKGAHIWIEYVRLHTKE